MACIQNTPERDQPAEPAASADEDCEKLRTIRSEDLFAGERTVLIQHAGEQYRLLVTRNNRLILQK